MEIKQQIKQFFEDNFMAEFDNNFTDDDSFLENGIIDSTGVLELIMFLEENYEIKVEDDEVIPENVDSFKNLELYINRKINV